MKKVRFTEEQIIGGLREHEAGRHVECLPQYGLRSPKLIEVVLYMN